MRSFRVCIFLLILILLCSSCAVDLNSSRNDKFSTDAIMKTPTGSLVPTPTVEITDFMSTSSPSTVPTEAGKASATTQYTGIPGLFNEDNFSKFFAFGMSMNAVEKELKALEITIVKKTNRDTPLQLEGIPDGMWRICSDHVQFDFDKNKRLYMIASDWETSKGFVPGDSLDTLHKLYGKEDEIECGPIINDNNYIYEKANCFFSVNVNDISAPENHRMVWRVFVDIWNDSHLLDKGISSSGLLAGRFTSEEAIRFNEDNISISFPFGMDRKELIKKLNSEQIRIIYEEDCVNDDGNIVGYVVSTDHISFVFDRTHKLDIIDVYGWPTSLGLKRGDSEEKLYQLYGKETSVQKNAGGDCDLYSYGMNGYGFILQFGDYFHPAANAFNYWSVSR